MKHCLCSGFVAALAAFASASHFACAFAQEQGVSILPPRFDSAAQSGLYDRVASRLIAPCCWAEPVRLHQSQAAAIVRAKLISYVRAGMSEREIQDRFAREYGERILGQPRGFRSVVAYGVPSFCCALGILALSVSLPWRKRVTQPSWAGLQQVPPDLPDLEPE